MNGFSFWYFISSWWMRAGWYIFFRRVSVKGRERIPRRDALVFAPNHQNAFMDAFTTATPILNFRQVYFMVRADVFNNAIGSFFLKHWRLIPAYRMRDGVENLSKNNEVFDRVQDLLKQRRGVIIYPEANHDIPRRLRPLKKGLARIVLGMDDRFGEDHDIPVSIIPTGMNYTDPHHFGGDVFIQYGAPINLEPYRKIYRENRGKALKQLMDDVYEAMKPLVIDIRTERYYHVVEECLSIWVYYKHPRDIAPSLRFEEDKKLIAGLESWLDDDRSRAESLKEATEEYAELRRQFGVRDWLLNDPKIHSEVLAWQIIMLVVMFPLALLGAVTHAWPLALGNRFAIKKIKDKGFRSSIIWAVNILLVSFNYYLLFGLSLLVLDPWYWAFGVPVANQICGWIWLKWVRKTNKLRGMLRYNQLRKQDAPNYDRMHQLRQHILRECEASFQ